MKDHTLHGGFVMPVWNEKYKYLFPAAYVSLGDFLIDYKTKELVYRFFATAETQAFDLEGAVLPNFVDLPSQTSDQQNEFEFRVAADEFDAYVAANASLYALDTGALPAFFNNLGRTDAYEQFFGYRPQILSVRVVPVNELLTATFMDAAGNPLHNVMRQRDSGYHDLVAQNFALVAAVIERAIARAGNLFANAQRVPYPPQIQALLEAANL